MLTELDWPRAHLVMDDFFAPVALAAVLQELPSFERRMKPGLVRDVGHDGQSVFFEHPRRQNRAVWIHDPSRTLRAFREQLWSAPMVEAYENAREPLFQILPNCSAPHLQVSSYRTGDHYDFHEDEGAGVNLTAIVFLATDPRRVHGGDLELSFEGDLATIPFRHNRLVVFPSKTLHRVTPVRIDGDRDARISLQCWLTYGSEPSKRPRRAPEADRPTFLLAEEPILRAAQEIHATGELAPEDLYWGAFYLSRILTSNLRCLVAASEGLTVGRLRVRRKDALEIYGRGRLGETPVRVGFTLRGPDVPVKDALRLFVETGKGKAATTHTVGVAPGATERETTARWRRLLARSVAS